MDAAGNAQANFRMSNVRRGAFTLVELLVVIAIIGVLVTTWETDRTANS